MRDWLREGFEYDLWANGVWIDALPHFRDRACAEKVVGHIHFALRLWLDRINDSVREIEHYHSLPVTKEGFASTTQDWLAWLESADLEKVQTFSRLDGSRFTFNLGQVSRHVINHGTFHRGHLRGLAQAEGLEEFEDTDYVQWLRVTGRAPAGE